MTSQIEQEKQREKQLQLELQLQQDKIHGMEKQLKEHQRLALLQQTLVEKDQEVHKLRQERQQLRVQLQEEKKEKAQDYRRRRSPSIPRLSKAEARQMYEPKPVQSRNGRPRKAAAAASSERPVEVTRLSRSPPPWWTDREKAAAARSRRPVEVPSPRRPATPRRQGNPPRPPTPPPPVPVAAKREPPSSPLSSNSPSPEPVAAAEGARAGRKHRHLRSIDTSEI